MMELVAAGARARPDSVARRVLGTAVRRGFEARFPAVHAPKPARRGKGGSVDTAPASEDAAYRPLVAWFAAGNTVDLSDASTERDHRAALERCAGLLDLVRAAGAATPEEETLLMELVLEGLHQSSVLARDDLDGAVTFKDMLKEMLAGMEGPEA
jgi:magnesium chelatase subunit I